MKYIVVIALIFDSGSADENKYDVFEVQIPVEVDGPKKAVLAAIDFSKKQENWEWLGYPDGPLLYGVRSVHSEPPFTVVSEEEYCQNRIGVRIASISEQQFQALKSYNEIHIPYSFMHIAGSS